MKRIVTEYQFSPEQRERVRDLAREVGLHELTAGILFSRGIDTPEKAVRFLHPSSRHFLSPFLMRGMRELKEEIDAVKQSGGTVAVFGDYDADGIGAASILLTALRRYGVNAVAHVPERADGYGMSVAAIDSILADHAPAPTATVDSGISNAAEVGYIRSRGVRGVDTDHHELPDALPDCTVVNPKLADEYPYDNLCGAGVAFKIACALLGNKAYDLLDIAALSTVADSVPLTGENRDIVSEGLRRINRAPRSAFRYLFAGKKEEVTAQSLAFVAAPRVNAAGRMGDAQSALRFFTSENESEVYELACRLGEYNLSRQQLCDEAYRAAKEKLRAEGAWGNVIMLQDEDWNQGLIGIVAARLVEEFRRPCILFARRGDRLKGSARTVENINIYEALKACSAHVLEFGGHAQAAGVTIECEQFGPLKEALDAYIGKTYGSGAGLPSFSVCAEVGEIDLETARELERLEPCGVGNKRPLFACPADEPAARRLKDGSPHLSLKAGTLDLVWFGGEKALPLLRSDLEKTVVFECGVSRFRGKESVRGIVRDVVFGEGGGELTGLRCLQNDLRRLCEERPAFTAVEESAEAIAARIRAARAACPYGLLLVCSETVPEAFRECVAGLRADVFRPAAGDVANIVLRSPETDAEISLYRDVLFLDRPGDFNLAGLAGKTVYVNADADGCSGWAELDPSHEGMAAVYRAVRRGLRGDDSVTAALSAAGEGIPPRQAVFALEVFAELGLVQFRGGVAVACGKKKTELERSVIYGAVRARGGQV